MSATVNIGTVHLTDWRRELEDTSTIKTYP